MSDDGKEKQLQPIIVVKRGGGDHDEHHGGVWKIAFADFMTAMMAFFLVMWLINAANEETRVQVASYFNPVKLTDAVAGPKGVRSSEPHSETEEHDNKTGTGDHNKSGGGGSSASDNGTEEKNEDEQASAMGEELLFKDPYAVLIDIAGKATPSQVAGALATEASNDGRPPGGEAFRDPFDPAFWRKPVDEILEQLPANADPDDTQADMVAAGQQMHVVAPKTTVARLPEEPVQKTASQPKPPGGQPMKRSGTEPEGSWRASSRAGCCTFRWPNPAARNSRNTGGRTGRCARRS